MAVSRVALTMGAPEELGEQSAVGGDIKASASDAVAPERQVPAWSEKAVFWGRIAAEVVVAVMTMTWVGIHRYLTLEQIEIGGDALKVWEFARQLAYGSPLPDQLNHHIARFGLVLPSFVGQLLWGSEATTYHWVVLTAAIGVHLATYLIARLLSGPLGGLVAVAVLIAFPEMVRASSQILPELFGPLYVGWAVVALLVYARATKRGLQLALVLCAGGLLFLAYGSKANFLYFAPGCALLTWWASRARTMRGERWTPRPRFLQAGMRLLRRWKSEDVLLLTATVVGLMLLETVLYQLFTKDSSQIAVITKTHKVSTQATVHQTADLFALYTKAPKVFAPVFAGAVASLLGVLALARDYRARAVAWTVIIFLLLQTFILRSVSPPIPWTRPHPRYLLSLVPMLAVLMGVFVHLGVEGALRAGRRGSGRGALSGWSGLLIAGALAGVVLSGMPDDWKQLSDRSHAVKYTQRMTRNLSLAFRQGIPIVSLTREAKPLRAAGSLYIRPELLLTGKTRRMPRYQRYQAKLDKTRHVYAKVFERRNVDRNVILKEIKRRVRRRSCVVLLKQQHRHFRGSTKVRQKACAPVPTGGKPPAHERLSPSSE